MLSDRISLGLFSFTGGIQEGENASNFQTESLLLFSTECTWKIQTQTTDNFTNIREYHGFLRIRYNFTKIREYHCFPVSNTMVFHE
jgi:hypothetical protein